MHHTGQRNYSEYRTSCRYLNIQLYASLWWAFFSIIGSSFILALSFYCLDCNASETMNSCFHVAPLNATVFLIQTTRGPFLEGRRRNTQKWLYHSISQRKLSLKIRLSAITMLTLLETILNLREVREDNKYAKYMAYS